MTGPKLSPPKAYDDIKPLVNSQGEPIRVTPPEQEPDGWEPGSVKRRWHDEESRIEWMLE